MSAAHRDEALRIIDAIALSVGVPRKVLIHGGRHRALSWPRQLAMYLVYAMEHLSLPEVGAVFGGRDHTTVLHGCRATWARFEAETPGMLHALVALAEGIQGDAQARRDA